jgi:arsenite methyltransferase
VLDLGSGSGRDCYAAAALVGESGRVTGVDMTAEQLATARKHSESFCKSLGYKACNLEFVEGYIEKAQILKRPISGDLV